MFYNADSGLYLTQYRAYDAISGRWLSRDPIGELNQLATPRGFSAVTNVLNVLGAARSNFGGAFDPSGAVNLYSYASSAPTVYIDPNGTFTVFGFGTAAGIVDVGGTFAIGTGYNFSSGDMEQFRFAGLCSGSGHRSWWRFRVLHGQLVGFRRERLELQFFYIRVWWQLYGGSKRQLGLYTRLYARPHCISVRCKLFPYEHHTRPPA